MLMGTVTSTPCTAVVAKTAEDNMFQLTPSGSAVESIAPVSYTHLDVYKRQCLCPSRECQVIWTEALQCW